VLFCGAQIQFESVLHGGFALLPGSAHARITNHFQVNVIVPSKYCRRVPAMNEPVMGKNGNGEPEPHA